MLSAPADDVAFPLLLAAIGVVVVIAVEMLSTKLSAAEEGA
jgi:Flp pilus assembly pilin Flp